MPEAALIPASTYRLQLRCGVDFRHASELVSYLAALGIDFLYLSPPFSARADSTHGYDVVDPNALDPALGGDAAFRELCDRLRQYGMGLLLDVVPNHLAADRANAFWWDVLEAGPASMDAELFDIDWSATDGRLHLPVLGDDFESVMARGEITLERTGGEIVARYFELAVPIAPATLPALLAPASARLKTNVAERLLAAIAELARAGSAAQRARTKQLLARAIEACGAGDAVARALDDCRGPALEALLDAQHYRLQNWRGPDALNYRRFFTISDLAGVRPEEPSVFARTHALLLSLIADGLVQGVRVDHPDGLRDPIAYSTLLISETTRANAGKRPYLVQEKILSDDETLRPELGGDGTTGYDTLRLLDSVFVQSDGAERVLDTYVRFCDRRREFSEVALAAKQRVLDAALAPELIRLARHASQLLSRDAAAVDETECRQVLRDIVACFPVYRSYVGPTTEPIPEADRAILEAAFSRARALETARPELNRRIESALCAPPGTGGRELLLKLQQLTGPAAAKGIEDCAIYRWFPLASSCEVGGSPDRFGIDDGRFHEENAARRQSWPHTMIATSTHDTKRSEDVRARISALSEIPEQWEQALHEWAARNRHLKRDVDGEPSPDANDEYLIYQTLLGIWPLDGKSEGLGERMSEYLVKALREAKRSSTWMNPNPEYEKATVDFALGLLDPGKSSEFLASFRRLESRIAPAAALSSLSRSVLKATIPGVPDYYQGSELWDLSLVDPDNRRPVDWQLRAELCAELRVADVHALLDSWRDGRIKLLVTQRCLTLRRRRRALFELGDYAGIRLRGPASQRALAFQRTHDESSILVAVGRYFCDAAPGDWQGSELVLPRGLTSGSWVDVLSGQRHELREDQPLDLAELFRVLPCAVLEPTS